jgi:EmrB/QacA subfamily drug resistance transporter
VLAATILGSSIAFIDGTVANVILPFLQKDLNATVVGVQWVVEAYALFLSALLLVGGSLGDRYGRRKIYVVGISVFAVASIACGLAINISQLIAARAVQGVGAALLVPGSLALISSSFSREKRGRAIGTWSGFSAITTAIGPVLGGWLVENVSWRAVFFLNIPLAVAVVVISVWKIPESRNKADHGSLDWRGALLVTIGLAGLVYGLIESSNVGFRNPIVILSLVCGVVALGLFVVNEAKAVNPMVPLKLFRVRNFLGANVLTLLLYAALGGTFFFLTLNLIQVQRYSATAAGAALLPFVALMFGLSRWSGGLVDRFGARLPLIIGPLVAACGFVLLALPGESTNFWTSFFPGVTVFGLGMAISVAPLTTTVMASVSEEKAGVASGINNAVSRVAGLLAIAVFGVVMFHSFSKNLLEKLSGFQLTEDLRVAIYQQRVRLAGMEVPGNLALETRQQIEHAISQSFVAGFRLLMIISAALAIGAALSSWWFVDNSGARRQRANDPH